ncbi:MAG: HPr family phosphocarrier protein [Calditrichaeota bacterium]|nr:HPr family phosphocarrier protein [Calditrichota bacterium]
MMKKKFTIRNKYGIHARPAGQLVKTASKFKSQVYISKNGKEVNAKSIMGVLMLEAGQNSEVEIRVEGEDEAEALAAINDLIDVRTFDER